MVPAKRGSIATLETRDKRAVTLSLVFRAAVTPISALLGLVNAAIIIANTGATVFGIVSLVATVSLLFPFADLGVGGIVTTAVSLRRAGGATQSQTARALRRAYGTLLSVAGIVATAAIATAALGAWGHLLGVPLSHSDNWIVTIVVCLFAASVPAGLGFSILTGLSRNELTVLINLLSSVAIVATSFVLAGAGANGLVYAVASVFGPLVAGLVATLVALFYLRRDLGAGLFLRASRAEKTGARPLAGAEWLLVINIGLPIGLQWGRVALAHVGAADDLAEYALGAQFYGAAFGIAATIGAALWPVFVRSRSSFDATIALWRRSIGFMVLLGVALGGALTALTGWVSGIVSGGQVSVSIGMAAGFGALILVQCLHLPSGALLTYPKELRWQALCVVTMAAISIVGALVLIPVFGGAAVPWAAAAGVAIGQFLPDVLVTRKIVARRSGLNGQAAA